MSRGVKVTWRGKQISGAAEEAAAEGLQDALYALLDDSSRLVPHEEGILQGSGNTDIDRAALEGSVFYDTPYAVRQHEDLTMRHPNGRQAKYLEQPLNERGAEYQQYIEDKIRAALT